MIQLRYSFTILLLIFVACSDSTGPDNNDDNGEATSLASQTIGTNGGTLSAEDISLEVPVGAFSENEVIEISPIVSHPNNNWYTSRW